MTRGWALAALGALAVIAGCGAPERRPAVVRPAEPVQTAATVFGGASNVADLNSATHVEAVRLNGHEFRLNEGERLRRGWSAPQRRGAPPDFAPNERGIVLGPVTPVASDDATALRSALTATETYVFYEGSSCLFSPGVLARFWVGDEPIDVLICFHCVELAAFRAGRPLGPWTGFDPGYRAVLDAVRRVFPDDQALRELSERKR